MIVALLVLIVLILLFGAGVVRGWLTSVIAAILGFMLAVGVILWIGTYFGENGPEYVLWGGMALLLLVALWLKGTEPIADTDPDPITLKSRQRSRSQALTREERKRLREKHRDGPRRG